MSTKVLWVGDAVVASGFANCTHAVCDELHEQGMDVSVLGLNYHGDPHEYPYDIYPAFHPLEGGRDGFGIGRLPGMVEKLRPDVVCILQDPWNIEQYLDQLARLPDEVHMPTTIGWIAVDGENVDGRPLNGLDHVAVWTQFAANELIKGGYEGEPHVVPLGVDHDVYYPRDGSRAGLYPPQVSSDAFIVGVVGRNQLRKRLDLSMKYFASWVINCDRDDAYLYMHVGPTGDTGVKIDSLAKYYGLSGKVIVAMPKIGFGVPQDHMARMYSTFDVLLNTGQGEGWGLPVLEAMACGTQCIVPNWSGLGSWAWAAHRVPCSSTCCMSPYNTLSYIVGGIMDEDAAVEALEDVYKGSKRDVKENARQYPWSRTGRDFAKLVKAAAG